MQLIPVIDVMNGQVVRGVAGQRHLYQPNRSCLVDSPDPVATCRALVRAFDPQMIYVADLDSIQTGWTSRSVLKSLIECDVPLAIDAGTTTFKRAQELLDLGAADVVIGLESLTSIDEVWSLTETLGPDRLIVSIDLLDGHPLGTLGEGREVEELIGEIVETGIYRLVILDLASVGMNKGVPTLALGHAVKNRWPEVSVWTGGGVRSLADLHTLALSLIDGVLLASALHDGRITPADWKMFEFLSDDEMLRAMDA